MALKKQMELFEEGGLMQEGGTVDEESGNEVPTGSLKKEVRDDIPAQLSEGEFVMPADVVRFHGLDKMMALRDEAKMGLQRMEDMGQMGNSEEAVISDGVPFSMDDLDIEDEPVEMQVGGYVAPQFTPGNMQQSQFAQYQPQFTPYTPPSYGGYQQPQQAYTPMAPTQVPTFTEFVRPKTVTYVDANGNEIQIPVGEDGTPLIPVPPGYTLKSDTPAKTDPTPDLTQQQTQVASTQTQQDDPTTPEDLARQREAAQRIKERKDAAKKLGYTKEANPLEGLLGTLIPGASLFGIGGNQEAGTIMPDGSIADGKGNTFDPRTGEQLGGKGFLGLGKSEAEKFGLPEDSEIPEASLAGLRSQAGEQSIKDLLSAIPPTEEKAPTDVGVETARVTEEGTAADVAAAQAAAGQIRGGFPTRTESMETLQQELIAQTANALMAKGVRDVDAFRAAETAVKTGDIDPDVAAMFGGASAALTDAGIAGRSLADADDSAPSGVAASIARSQRTKPEERSFADRMRESDRKEAAQLGISQEAYRDPDKRQAAISEASQAATETRREERIREEAVQHEQKYRDKGYSPEKAKKASINKARADNEAREQTGEPQAQAVTDRHGNAVRSGSDGSVVTSNREQKDDSPEPDSRWCCSQMVHRGLWTQQHEFARLTVWSSKQPNWWKSGYHVWGKVLAKTFLRKKGFWTDVMQSFYDYHIRKKPYTWRTALAHVMVYPGVFICGNIWTKQPKGVTLASFKELNG